MGKKKDGHISALSHAQHMMAYVTIRALDHSSFICTFPEPESMNLFFPLTARKYILAQRQTLAFRRPVCSQVSNEKASLYWIFLGFRKVSAAEPEVDK